jgi:hypothetical protein
MGVDQPRQHHVLAGVEGLVDRLRGRCASSEHFGDDAVFDHQPARGTVVVGGEQSEGILDPDTVSGHGRLSPEGLSSE